MIEFIEKWNLLQYVKVLTRNNNILDLIFTDDTDLIEDISQDMHSAISDHNTIDEDTIRKIKNDLINTDWNGVSAESLTNTIEEVINYTFEGENGTLN